MSQVNIVSGNGLGPSDNKHIPESMVNQIYVAILGHNGLKRQHLFFKPAPKGTKYQQIIFQHGIDSLRINNYISFCAVGSKSFNFTMFSIHSFAHRILFDWFNHNYFEILSLHGEPLPQVSFRRWFLICAQIDFQQKFICKLLICHVFSLTQQKIETLMLIFPQTWHFSPFHLKNNIC